jgi:hypothetical protein
MVRLILFFLLLILLEKYLYGVHKSRILLALQSGLPNEIDWAYNLLVKLSFNCPDNFHIGSLPGLFDCFLDPLDYFFSKLDLNLSSINFETSVNQEHLYFLDKFSDVSLLTHPEFGKMLERTLQVLHILRNFSFLEQNAM